MVFVRNASLLNKSHRCEEKNRLACASSHHPFFAPSFLSRMVQIHTIVNNPSNYIASLIKPNNFYHTPDDYHHLEIYNEKRAHGIHTHKCGKQTQSSRKNNQLANRWDISIVK